MQLRKGLKAAIKVVAEIGGCLNNGGIQPYKKAVSEQRERSVGAKFNPVSEQRRGKSAS